MKGVCTPVEEVVREAWVGLGKDSPNPDNFVFNLIKASIWGEGYGYHFEFLDNVLWGVGDDRC